MVMTVRTGAIAISQAELAAVVHNLLGQSVNMAPVVAADMVNEVRSLRERARTGKLTPEETQVLQGG
jgi:DNA-binding NarL/FixJ family response regulator